MNHHPLSSNANRWAAILLAMMAAACSPKPMAREPMTGSTPRISYRALGTEPAWSLTLDGATIRFAADDGDIRIIQPQPRAFIGVAGEIYQTGRIGVNIVHSRCSDTMSDRVYPDNIQITADGKSYRGCGGPADAAFWRNEHGDGAQESALTR